MADVSTFFVLFYVFGVSEAVTCTFPRCICLQLRSITYFCNEPVQDLSGYGRQLAEIEPGTFSQASFVTSLSLADNAPLILHTDSFQGLTNVTMVDVSGNAVESLPDNVFTPMSQVNSINLSNNALSHLNPLAFTGLHNLVQLSVGGNMLTELPLAQLFRAAPALSAISLHPNPIDCDDDNITELFQLVRSGVITDGNLLSCANGTKLADLNFDPTPTTVVTMATTVTTATIRPTTPTTLRCPSESTFLQTGYFVWPRSVAGTNVTTACLNGPKGGVASRYCLKSGKWSKVDDLQCNELSGTAQRLATLREVVITNESSASVASQLAQVTSDPSGISVDELSTVVEIAEQLVQVGSDQVQVLNETLQAIDSLVGVSNDVLSQASPQLTTSLRDILDRLLLGALSIDKADIVLNFPNLAVGGSYLPPTSDGRLLAVIHQNTQNELEMIEVGGASGDRFGDVLVDIEGFVANSNVQLTVYGGNELFSESNCSNNSNSSLTRGNVLGPIISVISGGASPNNEENEIVTIRYNDFDSEREEGMELVCVRWTTDQTCGSGRWAVSGCSLTRDTSQRVVVCTCLKEGTYAIIEFSGSVSVDVPTVTTPLDENDIIRVVFYVISSLPLVLYLTIATTILLHSQLRSIPLFQVLIGLSLSQGVTHLLIMLSYELSQVPWPCYSLGLLFHYFTLVTLNWMMSMPVMTVIKVFKRIWYEKVWLMAPFAAFSIVWPAVIIAIYGGLRYSIFDANSTNCWLEASVFPNTLVFLFGVMCLVTIATQLVSLLLLCCSDYSLESSTYLKLCAMTFNTLSFSFSVVLTYFTAAAPQFNTNRHYILLPTSIAVLITGAVFFAVFGMCRPKIREAMSCHRGKDKTANYASTWKHGKQPSHQQRRRSSAMSLILSGRRRPPKDDMNINYIDDYLGFTHPFPADAPIPLAMFKRVHPQGRVKRTADLGGVVSGHGVGQQRRLAQSSEA